MVLGTRSCKGRNEVPSISKKVEVMNGISDGHSNFGNGRQHPPRRRNQNHNNNLSEQGIMTDSMLEEGSNCLNGSLMDSCAIQKKGVRFIKKSGHCNVSHTNLSDKPRRFIADIFTTGVDLQWRWNLFVFSAAFVISWVVFGLIYWLVSYINGDFEEHHTHENSTFKSCIKNLDIDHPFTSSFLFSLETQTTIGYGLRVVTEQCPVTILMVVLQSVFGCILDAFMIGLIMAKISRPKKRAETLLFSRNAVINMRDGRLCLMFRVGNLRKSHLVEATIRMQYVYSRETIEGEFIPLEQIDLNLDLKNDSDRLFLVTPQTICHPIDDTSPLWNLHPEDLHTANFEIIVILEGMVEATGMTTQARASYLPSEILWGHRFHNMISLTRNNTYKVNFKKFHVTNPTADAPTQSASELYQSKDSDTHSMVESSVTMRGKKPRQSISSNSSTRSSIRSSQHNPSSASDGRDSGYTAVEDLRGYSNHSVIADANKPMTSTTSLSDESDSESERKKKKSAPANNLLLVQSNSDDNIQSSASSQNDLEASKSDAPKAGIEHMLIDVSETPPRNPKDIRRVNSFKAPTHSNREANLAAKENSYKSSDDINMLLLRDSKDDASCQSVQQTEFNGEEIDKAFGIVPIETKSTLCV
ncbi:ATP-sensitive inward rectifier potassium channel 12-like isoform X2 [Clavelina lepadiformis]|uniref:ATP-sensitive inward rectifier potassium channel 12-like isoform X2 n=1 Tax=Clavelina lepadiformis TaxID=159417 RepID=UPI0040415478